MTGLRAQKKRRTKQDLATAAVDLLLSEGRDGATVASIAARAGVSTRTFHNYFAAREDAFLHFVEEIVAEWIREVESAPADETPFETLHRTIRDLCNRPGGDSTAAANLMTITEHALAGMGMEGRARVVGMFAGVVDIIVARSDQKDNADYQKVVKAYHTKSVADAINENYKGAVVPVFKY